LRDEIKKNWERALELTMDRDQDGDALEHDEVLVLMPLLLPFSFFSSSSSLPLSSSSFVLIS
jgi:hypothetical protein